MSRTLEHFVTAQAPVYDAVVAELRAGHKTSHWMWFVFPQLAGLGRSPTAQRYALAGLDEARAYAAHPLLGPRLRECTNLVNSHHDRTLDAILGDVDALKFHSSMTLFARAADDRAIFTVALDQWFGGREDELTVTLLAAQR